MLSYITTTETRLRELGVLPGMRVALSMSNTAATAVTTVACWRLGAVVVPLSARYSQVQSDAAIKGMGCDKSITTPVCQYQGYRFEFVCLADLDLNLSEDATIVLTSGSTGQPKGVLHTLANHVASARASDDILPFGQGDTWLVSLPLYHVGGLALVVRALLHGGSLLFCGKDWQTALVQETVTHMSVVPTQLKCLLEMPEAIPALQSLKVVLVGGAPCPDTLVHQAQALGIPIHITYGASEAASQITTTRGIPIGSGSALSHCQVCINQDNEILVKGQSLARGYVTEGRVFALADEQDWFHTGDLGRLDSQGNLFVLGRRDTQFISGGENIRPEEIEQAILTLPEVEQCAVVPVPDVTYGQRPVVFIKGTLNRQALTHALSRLEKFKHPDHILDWPEKLAGQIKPNRALMQDLAKSQLAL